MPLVDIDLIWTPLNCDADVRVLPCRVTRLVLRGDRLSFTFQGMEPELGSQFTGIIGLQLTIDKQETLGICETNSTKGVDKDEFRLVGCFTDSSFIEFRGVWSEEGVEYEFEMFGVNLNDAERL